MNHIDNRKRKIYNWSVEIKADKIDDKIFNL